MLSQSEVDGAKAGAQIDLHQFPSTPEAADLVNIHAVHNGGDWTVATMHRHICPLRPVRLDKWRGAEGLELCYGLLNLYSGLRRTAHRVCEMSHKSYLFGLSAMLEVH